MDIKFCHIHTDVAARTRCFQCQKNLCHQCRQLLSHHYFCSEKCHRKFRWESLVKGVKKRKMTFILAWNVALTLGVIALVTISFNPSPAGSENTAAAVTDSLANATLTAEALRMIDSLAHNASAARSEIRKKSEYQLSITAERGWVVNVWRNDWPIVNQIIRKPGEQVIQIPLAYGENRIRMGVWNTEQRLINQDNFEVTYKNPLIETLRQSIYRGNTQRRQLSLTFDGGSLENGAREILTILAEKNIVTTMFITGQFIEKYPDLVLEIVNAGHEVANHTYNHPHLTTYEENRRHRTGEGVNRAFLHRQLIRTDSLFTALTGCKMLPFWRAPYGEVNQEILDWAAETGFMHVGWTRGFDTRDWVSDPASPAYMTPEEVYQSIIAKDNGSSGLNGAIVLMHLGTERQTEKMFSMLPDLINDLQLRGYETVPVSNLLNP